MSDRNEIYDVSAELARELGEVGTKEREEATVRAWEEYNAQILLDAKIVVVEEKKKDRFSRSFLL